MSELKFPSISQFRSAFTHVRESTRFVGLDENYEPIFDHSLPLPVLNFTGTVKLHGTNAGITYDPLTGTITARSKRTPLTIENDNYGFAFFVKSMEDKFREMFEALDKIYYKDFPEEPITVYGEWCGEGIQSKVAISQLEKMFVIFDLRIGEDYWADSVDHIQTDPIWNVYRITEFPTFAMKIDFSSPENSVNTLIDLTKSVEEQCPVGKYFNVDGVGEGIVWKAHYKGNVIRFKVKGEMHSSSKVKTLASVDPEKLSTIKDFVDYAVTENRLHQGYNEVYTSQNRELSKKYIGDFVNWVRNDVFKEELDTLHESGLVPKDVVGSINKKASTWIMKKFTF